MKSYDTLAAVDLGSNSFRLEVARVSGDQLYPLDSLKETVRLAGGLGDDKILDEATQSRALGCLHRFGERLRGLPPETIRCVGTSALRVARNADQFISKAETALGHPIEIVAGREEARLIYLGVAHSLPSSPDRRLVVDIGGGTTDIAIFQDGIIRHTAVIPFGGEVITEDVKEGCSIIKKHAEELKVKFGSALASENREDEVVAIPGLRGRPPKEITLRNLANIIQARMEEIIEQVYGIPACFVDAVEDDGAGIPENLSHRVFQEFFSSKGTEGTGIGLLVVQKVAEEHGGKVSFDSKPGRGTVFTVVIPSAPAASRPAAPNTIYRVEQGSKVRQESARGRESLSTPRGNQGQVPKASQGGQRPAPAQKPAAGQGGGGQRQDGGGPGRR